MYYENDATCMGPSVVLACVKLLKPESVSEAETESLVQNQTGLRTTRELLRIQSILRSEVGISIELDSGRTSRPGSAEVSNGIVIPRTAHGGHWEQSEGRIRSIGF